MGRKLRTTVPIISKQLLPHLPVTSTVREKEEKIRERQQHNFNNHYQARQFRPLQTGEHVYILDNSTEGTVAEESYTHSYVVHNPGRNYRCNRRHLLPLPSYSVSNSNNITTYRECCTK